MKIRLLKQPSPHHKYIQQNIQTQCNILGPKISVFQQSVRYCHRKRSLSSNKRLSINEHKNKDKDKDNDNDKIKYKDTDTDGKVRAEGEHGKEGRSSSKGGLRLLQQRTNSNSNSHSNRKLNGKSRLIGNQPLKLKNRLVTDHHNNSNRNNANIISNSDYHGSWGIPRYPTHTYTYTNNNAHIHTQQTPPLSAATTKPNINDNIIGNKYDNSRIYELYDRKVNGGGQQLLGLGLGLTGTRNQNNGLYHNHKHINNNNNSKISNSSNMIINNKQPYALKSISMLDQSWQLSKNNMGSTRISNTCNNTNHNYSNYNNYNNYNNNLNDVNMDINMNDQYRFSNSSILNKNIDNNIHKYDNNQQFIHGHHHINKQHRQLFSARSQTLLTPHAHHNTSNTVHISRAISKASRKNDKKYQRIQNLQQAREVNTVFSGDLSHVHSHHSNQMGHDNQSGYQHGYQFRQGYQYGNQLMIPSTSTQSRIEQLTGKLQRSINILQESIVIGAGNSDNLYHANNRDFWN